MESRLYSAGLTNFAYQLLVEASLATMLPFKAASKRSCQHIENDTAANEGEVEEGERADKNGMSNFIFNTSHFLFRSAAADNL